MWQLVKYILYLFEYPDQGQVNNKEAFELLTQNREVFLERVAENVRLSCEKLYDPPPTYDPHYITFTEFNGEIHEPVLKEMKRKNDVAP